MGRTLIGHTHTPTPQQNSSVLFKRSRTSSNELSRDAPGPGDASPLRLGSGYVSGIITVNGYHYLIYGTANNPTVIYVGGGLDDNFGSFIEKNWKPNNKHIKKISREYLNIQRNAAKQTRKSTRRKKEEK